MNYCIHKELLNRRFSNLPLEEWASPAFMSFLRWEPFLREWDPSHPHCKAPIAIVLASGFSKSDSETKTWGQAVYSETDLTKHKWKWKMWDREWRRASVSEGLSLRVQSRWKHLEHVSKPLTGRLCRKTGPIPLLFSSSVGWLLPKRH